MASLPTKAAIAIQLGIAGLVCLLFQIPLGAETGPEPDAKAAFLVNFLKFANFPSQHRFSGNGKVRIACLGSDPVFQGLTNLQSKMNSRIEVSSYQTLPSSLDAELVVIGSSEVASFPGVLSELRDKTIFTASEIKDFARDGGMLEFGYSTNRINYQINIDEVRSHHLQVSSRLLKLGAGKGEGKQ
ncbi:MAG: hypothetical protein JWM04_422 [Verrucomicrobiales bacterium]|nr:hypothetical protein [Verrucomicrobiales bacterium]